MKNFLNILGFARKHSILISKDNRKIGIQYTLIGWALIALATTLLKDGQTILPAPLNFFLQFAAAFMVLTVAVLFKGVSFLKVSKSDKVDSHGDDRTQLSPKDRWLLLIFRGILASGGYIAYCWARVSIGVIDNSALFSADALMYAGLMFFFLKQKVRPLALIGIVIAFFGVFTILYVDFESFFSIQGLVGAMSGLLASFALALIILINSILVQHDPPLKIAFYQSIIGLTIACLILLFSAVFDSQVFFPLDQFPLSVVINSMLSGVIYGIALIFFFTAFLYTEPLVISALGYSLFIFLILMEWIVDQETISKQDFMSSLIILLGSGLVVLSEYMAGAKKLEKKVFGLPTYLNSHKKTMQELRARYKKGDINLYAYITELHEFNKLLFEYSKVLDEVNISRIVLENGRVIFSLKNYNIKIEADPACRSAPFEVLNLGEYENTEIDILLKLLDDNSVVFDVGAHIGWYSTILAKHFPNGTVYSFEPIPDTFSYLKRNIELNNISNAHLCNFGFSDQKKTKDFFFFQGGSALASEANLIEHDNTIQISCKLEVIDEFVEKEGLSKLDFMKLDIEGGEFFALKGAVNTLRSLQPIILVEIYQGWCEKFNYSCDDILEFLQKLGYSCFYPKEAKLISINSIEDVGSEYNFNFFFLHNEKHSNIIKLLT